MGTTPLPPKGGGGFLTVPEEHKALVKEARELWKTLAPQRANPYLDNRALLLVGRMALEATRWADGLVVLAAIEKRMDSKSSPRWIPEWARELRAQREDRDRAGRCR